MAAIASFEARKAISDLATDSPSPRLSTVWMILAAVLFLGLVIAVSTTTGAADSIAAIGNLG